MHAPGTVRQQGHLPAGRRRGGAAAFLAQALTPPCTKHLTQALATLRLICEGAYKGPSDQASATEWLAKLRASLRAAAAAPPYSHEDDRTVMARVTASYRALWTRAAGGLSLAQGAHETSVYADPRMHDQRCSSCCALAYWRERPQNHYT